MDSKFGGISGRFLFINGLMFLKAILGLCMLSFSLPFFAMAVDQKIKAGDDVQKVYKVFGTPRLEFPVKGVVQMHYDHSIVKTRDGKVISILPLENSAGSGKAQVKKKAKKTKSISLQQVSKMAKDGDAESQYLIGYWKQTGNHLPMDKSEAIQWYSRAAYQGHAAAQHNLGVCYMNGDGVDKDLEQAYVWALLAAENGNDTLKKALERMLTREQMLSCTMRVDQIRINLLSIPADKLGKGTVSEIDPATAD
jgi:hypothetical protein